MRLLLDSHVIVWWALYPGRLNEKTRGEIISADNQIFISSASAWELALKESKGKLKMPDDYWQRLLADGIEELEISTIQAVLSTKLPPIHGDPFDRLLVAQAKTEELTLVTKDEMLAKYEVPILSA